MDGEAMKDRFTDATKGSVPASETGEGQSGMRTERVTLEVTREAWRRATPTSPDNWAYAAREAGITFLPGESVRVVEEVHFDDLAQVAMERDAAIREREKAIRERDWHEKEYYKLRGERITQAIAADRFASAVQEADTLRARVASLEEQLESVADRAAAAETALEAAPAASGAAWTEVVAWGVMSSADPPHRVWLHWEQELAERWARKKQCDYNAQLTVFPLYAAPQPAKGWLTEEERKCIKAAITVFGGMTAAKDPEKVLLEFWVDKAERDRVFSSLQSLLARSSPPEVVLTEVFNHFDTYGDRVASFDADRVRKALAAAGVPWKEVG